MGYILGPGQPGLHHGKSRLHEHDQKAGKQYPHHIYAHLVMAYRIAYLGQGRLTGLGRRYVRNGSGIGPAGIRLGRYSRFLSRYCYWSYPLRHKTGCG